MKILPAFVLSAALLPVASAPAQLAPKLAIAKIIITPTLAVKNQPAAAAPDTQPSAPLDLTGVWNGETHSNGKVFPFVLTITKPADGAQYAELKNIKRGNDFHSTSVSCRDDHVTVTFGEGGKSQFLDGRFDAANNRLVMLWNNGGGNSRLVLQRSQLVSAGKPSAGTVAPVVALEAVTHSLEMQISDQFAAEHRFTLLEGDELEAAVPPPEKGNYNLKDAATAEHFRRAGVRYVLLTTVEDMKNETVNRAQGRVAYETASGVSVGVRESSRKEAIHTGAHADIATQGKFEEHRVIDQNVYLLVRCRLLDAATGEVLDSASHTFTTNRTYIALAAGAKEVSASDLFETAARVLAGRIATRERELLFPVTVLEKTETEITFNLGADAGVKMGQVFDVVAAGKILKDPTTGEPLGRDDQIVGRAAVTQLQPKFSKAKIWEDHGIATGNLLRRVSGN